MSTLSTASAHLAIESSPSKCAANAHGILLGRDSLPIAECCLQKRKEQAMQLEITATLKSLCFIHAKSSSGLSALF